MNIFLQSEQKRTHTTAAAHELNKSTQYGLIR